MVGVGNEETGTLTVEEALINGGALVSIIPQSIVQNLGLENKMESTTRRFCFGGGSSEKATGWIDELKLVFGGELVALHCVLVFSNRYKPFLSGPDFIVQTNVLPDRHQQILRFCIKNTEGDLDKVIEIPTHHGFGAQLLEEPYKNSSIPVTIIEQESGGKNLMLLEDDFNIASGEVELIRLRLENGVELLETGMRMEKTTATAQKGLVTIPTVIQRDQELFTALINSAAEGIKIPKIYSYWNFGGIADSANYSNTN